MATPSQIRSWTPQGKEALDFLNKYKAAQASVPPAQGSPGFTGPPRPMPPAPQGTISRVAGATANAARTTAGVVGRGLAAVGTVPLATGAAMLAYPSKLGDGTLGSPEAQQAIAENEKINRAKDPRIAAEPTSGFVNSLKVPAQVSSPSSPGVSSLPDNPTITRGITPTGNGMERRVYISPQGAAMGAVPIGRGQSGYVGATTDEEADRNLQSRFQQDAAASQMAQSFDRSTEALRDLRAERMGIPRSRLDVAEGRAQGQEPQTSVVGQTGQGFGDDVLDRDRFLRQFQAAPGSLGGAKKLAQANTIAAQQIWDQNQQAIQRPVTQAPAVNPLDAQRFLLDQQKFGWQQGVDKGRLTLDQAKVQNEAATTSLAQKKQDLEAKSAFTQNFSIGKEGAPDSVLAAGAWEISKATGVPAEIVQGYIQQSNIDWKNGPPANMTKYLENITAQITRDDKGQ